MFNHVFIKLKTRPHQKAFEIRHQREEVEKAMLTEAANDTKSIVQSQNDTILAAELSVPCDTLDDLPLQLRNVLITNKHVDIFAPSLIVKSSSPDTPQPSVADSMLVFKDFASKIDFSPYEAYGLHCIAARNIDRSTANAQQFGADLRDTVQSWMSENSQLPSDRSPEMKAKLDGLRAIAQQVAKENNAAYKKPSLRTLPFHMDLTRDVGFWYTFSEQGGGAPKSLSDVNQQQVERCKNQSVQERIGSPVVVCKIGEIFLKKGNRSKFLSQLQTNIQFKLQGKAFVQRQQYQFVVKPPGSFNGRPFTSAELEDIRSIVAAIPGIESYYFALQTLPVEQAMLTSMQYLLAEAALENRQSVKKSPLNKPTIYSPTPEYVETSIAFLKGAAIPEEGRTEEQKLAVDAYIKELQEKYPNLSPQRYEKLLNKRLKRLGTHLEDIYNLGFKLNVSFNSPCFYTSRSKLATSLQERLRTDASLLRGTGEMILNPGFYQKKLREELLKNRDPLASDDSDDEATVTTDDTNDEDITQQQDDDDDDDDDDDMTDKFSSPTADAAAKRVSQWVRPVSGADLRLDVHSQFAYISYASDNTPSTGGQPTGTGNDTHTVVCLLSGGMDSPVAAHSMMKRGMRVVLVHFQNANLADEETVQNKIIQLSEHLSKYQIYTYLHIVPFSAIQDAIITEVPSPARMLVYRRFMMAISAKIAQKYGATFLVVGDAVGQVASQTPANMYASYCNTPLPLLSPLVGSNKQEIMDTAKKIGTFDISALPYGDCCSYFLAKHPLTAIKKEVLQQYEQSVGRAIEGGNAQLIADAQNASAIYRWFRPADGMVSLRAMSPVKSYHDNAATTMLMSCPINLGKKDAEDEQSIAEGKRKLNSEVTINDEEEQHILDITTSKRVKQDDQSIIAPSEDASITTTAPTTDSKYLIVNDKKSNTSAAATTTTATTTEEESYQIKRSYLDNAATTRSLPSVMANIERFISGPLFGNSASLHLLGKTSDLAIKNASLSLLALINAHPRDVDEQASLLEIGGDDRFIYTSGGTESNNLAIFGSLRQSVQSKIDQIVEKLGKIPMGKKLPQGSSYPTNLAQTDDNTNYVIGVHLITSSVEHHAVLEPLEYVKNHPETLISNRYGLNISLNIVLDEIGVTNQGIINTSQLFARLNYQPHIADVVNMEKQTSFTPANATVIDAATFISVMHANNEVGAIQPLIKIGQALETFKSQHTDSTVYFHTDACQSFGKIHLDVQAANLDLVTLNAHKLHGMKGIGSLYVRPGVKLLPVQLGGGHQHGLRSGTVNVPGVVSFQSAATYAYSIPDNTEPEQIRPLLNKLYAKQGQNAILHDELTQHGKEIRQKQLKFAYNLRQLFPRSIINGPLSTIPMTIDESEFVAKVNDFEGEFYDITKYPMLPNIISILIDPSSQLDSSGIVKYLSSRNVFVSAGSACASNNSEPTPSHVLKSIGLKDQWSNGTIRVSLSGLTTQEEIDTGLEVFKKLAYDLHTTYSKSSH